MMGLRLENYTTSGARELLYLHIIVTIYGVLACYLDTVLWYKVQTIII